MGMKVFTYLSALYKIFLSTFVDRRQDNPFRLSTPAPIQNVVKPLLCSMPPFFATQTYDAVAYAENAMLQNTKMQWMKAKSSSRTMNNVI